MALMGLAMMASVICVHTSNIAPQFQPGRVTAIIPCGCGIIHPSRISRAGLQRKLAELFLLLLLLDSFYIYIIPTSTTLIGRSVTFNNLKFPVIVTFNPRLYCTVYMIA
jgi:hypothetical protein